MARRNDVTRYGANRQARTETLEHRVLLAASLDHPDLLDASALAATHAPATQATSLAQNAVSISIPDANLLAAIRSALGKPTGDITDEDMATLTSFSAASAGIVNLSGLQYAINLQDLDLYGNVISNLTPLSGLSQLQWLSLSANQISDLTPLSGLTQLMMLELNENQISNLAPLAGMTQLQSLSLNVNQIGSIASLAGLTQVVDLGLNDNQISDLAPLAGLTQLQFLYLGSNQISNIAPLAGLTQMLDLNLAGNQISSLTALAALTQLSGLYVESNQISDLAPLSGLSQLQWLSLSANQISNLTPLSGLTQLMMLELNTNQISNLAPLAGMTQLQGLSLNANQISNLTPLTGLNQLTVLDLNSNQISDLTPLAGLTSPFSVDVSYNALDVATGSAARLLIDGWIAQGATVTYLPQRAAPTDISLSAATVAENQPAGTLVGTLSATDPDAGDTLTFTLVTGAGSADNASFQIVGNELRTAASFDYEAKSSYSIRVRVTDLAGLSFEEAFTITVTNVPDAAIAARNLFYNRSAFDGNNAAANTSDDAAIATDKTALLPGQTATFANYSSYSRGLNGIMVDLQGLTNTLTASDFTFKVGNNNTPSGWTAAPAPTSITQRALAGGITRVTLIWADNAIQKQWLQVTVLASATTDLASNDTFYFGNAIGECGNSTTNAQVTTADEAITRNNQSGLSNVPITNVYDYNRDGRVNSQDLAITRGNRSGLFPLLLITTPPAGQSLSPFSQSLINPEPALLS